MTKIKDDQQTFWNYKHFFVSRLVIFWKIGHKKLVIFKILVFWSSKMTNFRAFGHKYWSQMTNFNWWPISNDQRVFCVCHNHTSRLIPRFFTISTRRVLDRNKKFITLMVNFFSWKKFVFDRWFKRSICNKIAIDT